MTFILIAGIAGSGKSTVGKELESRGYETHDTDNTGNAGWYRRDTGELVDYPETLEQIDSFYDQHEWVMPVERVVELKNRSTSRIVFLCGMVANWRDLWELFDYVICLTVDQNTLKHRLAHREEFRAFGRLPEELRRILSRHPSVDEEFRLSGATLIDSTQPGDDVVDAVLTVVTSLPIERSLD